MIHSCRLASFKRSPIPGVVLFAGILSPWHVAAQTGAGPGMTDSSGPRFDVVSVKPSGTNEIRIRTNSAPVSSPIHGFRYTPGRLTCNLPLASLIEEAYSVRSWQLSGPEWIGVLTYDVAASMPAATSRPTARLMLRSMLAERFGLRLQHQQRESPVYGLVVAKKGFQLTAAPDPGAFDYTMGTGRFHATAIPLTPFANWLTSQTDLPVVDMTHISGAFKIDMEWTPDPQDAPRRWDAGVFRAVERLGLSLERRKVLMEHLEIVQVNRIPTTN